MKSNAMEDITSLTPTICKLMKISNPSLSGNNFLKPVIKAAKQELGITPVDKCMIYFPDAIGTVLSRNHQSAFKPVLIRLSILERIFLYRQSARQSFPLKEPRISSPTGDL